jgi:peptidoglycan/LPS O-acetylase OafA/YrhL
MKNYRPQPDSLRAIAITIVMIHHNVRGGLPVAGYAVGLFYALSGFFVTQSLLRLRAEHEAGAGLWPCLRKYYTRRWLRLLPTYWLLLLVATVFAVPYAREWFWAHALFLTNFAMLWKGEWFGRFSHFWSLGVLEQFYMVWPLLMLVWPRAKMGWLIVGTMALGPLYRLVCEQMQLGFFAWTVVPVAWMDALGAGALVAWAHSAGKERIVGRVGAWAAGVFLATKLVTVLGWGRLDSNVWSVLFVSLAFLWIIEGAWRGFSGPGRIMDWPVLCWLGKMSYGMFLLHNFTGLLIPRWGPLGAIMDSDSRILLIYPCTVLLAWLMWLLVEEPVARFRRR